MRAARSFRLLRAPKALSIILGGALVGCGIAPAQDETPPADAPAAGEGLLTGLGQDFRHVIDRDNLFFLASAGAASLAIHRSDRQVTNTFKDSAALDGFFEAGAVGGGGLVQIGGAAATYALGRATGSDEVRSLGSDLIRAQVVSGVLTMSLKRVTHRARPDGSSRASFPSGHSSATFATATVLERRYGWKAGVPAYLFATYVAGSRLQENKHFPSDVLFGAAIGIVGGRSATWGRGRGRVALTAFPPAGGGFGVAFVGSWR